MDHGEGGNLRVPFQQRRRAAGQLVGQPVQLPHRVDHLAVVRVDEVRAAVGVAGQVELHHALVRHVADVLDRVEVVVDAGDVDVVHVQQQAAVGLLGQAA